MTAVSVSSTSSNCGFKPDASSARRIWSTRLASLNCEGARLTATRTDGSPSLCHAFAWRHASKRSHSPMASRRPPSSPIEMNSFVGFRSAAACRQAEAWQSDGLPSVRVAVNLAPAQSRLANLVDQIRRALEASGLNPQLLEVELTETAVMSDAEESIQILEAISRMGVL